MDQPLPVDLQLTIAAEGWPNETVLKRLALGAVGATLSALAIKPATEMELSLLFTDNDAIAGLNARWRGKDGATNVLSFPAQATIDIAKPPSVLGDIAFAFEIISMEAKVENKPFEHHLSHLIVHGLLHLFGYDHQNEKDATQMEALESRILAKLAIPDPYGMMHGHD